MAKKKLTAEERVSRIIARNIVSRDAKKAKDAAKPKIKKKK